MANKQEALDLIKQTTENKYPMRWVDEQTSVGDFEGREAAVDVFNFEFEDSIKFLGIVRDIRPKLKELLGSTCIFIFHSAEATKTHYSHLAKDLL